MNPADLHTELVDRLNELTVTNDHLSVYSGQVPDDPPAAPDGRVWPYVVVWGSAGSIPEEARPLSGNPAGILAWSCPVTVAAGDPLWCLRAAHLVRGHLDDWVIDQRFILTERPGTPPMTRDLGVTPPRWFVAFTFHAGFPAP